MQKVLITGGSVGIGRATAVAFAKQGAQVVINYNRSEKEAQETLRLAKEAGGSGFIAQADVSCEASATALVKEASRLMGGLDVLVNNAGITRFIPFSDMDAVTAEIWDALYKTNVESIFFCSREAAKIMPAGSSIINLASISGMLARGSSIPYSVSKAAIIQLTRCLANTLAPKIRVNCVAPGTIENTRWFNVIPDADVDNYKCGADAVPLKRLGDPTDIANAILFLVSEQGSYITGINVPVEGGICLK